MIRVVAYIDGYNLFYGRLKHKDKVINEKRRQLRWLNLHKLIERFCKPIENYDIQKINFYTAKIKAFYQGDKSPKRQREYFKALKTIDNLKIIKGRFSENETCMPKAPISNPIEMVEVIKIEEKRSDVNLACHLVKDAYENNFDLAVIITNDSDLLEPIKIVKYLKKDFLILSPHNPICYDFVENFGKNEFGDYDYKNLRKISNNDIKQSQFPDEIIDEFTNKLIAKRPDKWKIIDKSEDNKETEQLSFFKNK